MSTLSPMPHVKERAFLPSLTSNVDSGYLVSFRDYAEDNREAVEWFLENSEQIRHAVNSHAELVAALERAELDLSGIISVNIVDGNENRNPSLVSARNNIRATLAKVSP